MAEVTFEDLEALHPRAGLLSKAHLAAEDRRLDPLFDAYQALFMHGGNRLKWRALANAMEIVMQSKHLLPAHTESRLVLEPEHPYRVLLSTATSEDFGHHTSDILVAFFHHTGILLSQHHIERKSESSGPEVVDWTTRGPDDAQAVIRTHFLQLSRGFLRVSFEGIKDEIIARLGTRLIDITHSDFLGPCSPSLLDILLYLDIQIDPGLLQVIEKKAGRLRKPPTTRWTFQPSARSAAEHASLFRRLRKVQGSPTALEPIKELRDNVEMTFEDDGQSIMSFMGPDISEQSNRNSKHSSFSDFMSFITARSHVTGSSVRRLTLTAQSRRSATTNATTNRSSIQTFLSWPIDVIELGLRVENEWSLKLRLRNIVSDPELEDWSAGRGQHAQFSSGERSLIPLASERLIAETSTAIVDSVICRQVRLVRKVIVLHRRIKKLREYMKEEVMREVQQLYNAQHAHIVRLVGTYVIENQLAILTYPMADWNLDQFLHGPPTSFQDEERRDALQRFFGCLAKVLDFIHSFPIKHKDIKPQNILVRDMRASAIDSKHSLQVYLADFGSSKVYPSAEDTRTEGATTYTKIYAPSEVLDKETRGLSSDIFSLGCVFAEMLATAVDYTGDLAPRNALFELRDNGDDSSIPYCFITEEVCDWLAGLKIDESHTTFLAARLWISLMLSNDPQSSQDLQRMKLLNTLVWCGHAQHAIVLPLKLSRGSRPVCENTNSYC